jgi:hypothetical protein
MILSRIPVCESEPKIRERIFGSVQAKIAEETEKTQLTIRTGV